MNKTSLPYWLALMVLFAALYGGYKWWQVQRFQNNNSGGVAFEGPPLDGFTLTDHLGRPFHSKEMKGKVWVVSFFFATCAGTCPKLNANIQHLNSLDELRDVTWVSISVDPVSDTPEVLEEYAGRFGADPERWFFCRGELDYIKRLGRDVLKVSNVGFRVHNDVGIIIGRDGGIRGVYDPGSYRQLELMRKRLLEVLAEPDEQEGESAPTDEPKEENAPPVEATT